jgi:hypothetical protein
MELYPFPHTSAWRGALVQGQLYFSLILYIYDVVRPVPYSVVT